VWVTDFGLAEVEGAEDLTGSGMILGTPRYLAPENLRGVWDPRSDIYGLGVTLHELLALEPAFNAENRADLLMQIAARSPRPLRQIDRRIPAPLEAIVLKATCADPRERYQSAAELAADLGRFLDEGRVEARLPLPERRRRRMVIVRRAGAAALISSLVVLGAMALLHQRPLKPQDLLLADVDGDQRVDLVAANSGVWGDDSADSIAIVYNQGGGAFRRPEFVETGDVPVGLAFARLDGDGSRQIAFADCLSQDLSRLRRSERGSFSRERLVELDSKPTHLAAMDLDGDERDDLALTFNPLSDARVFWNGALDPFKVVTTVPVGPAPYFIGAADLDRDGKVDLVTSNGMYSGQEEGFIAPGAREGAPRFRGGRPPRPAPCRPPRRRASHRQRHRPRAGLRRRGGGRRGWRRQSQQESVIILFREPVPRSLVGPSSPFEPIPLDAELPNGGTQCSWLQISASPIRQDGRGTRYRVEPLPMGAAAPSGKLLAAENPETLLDLAIPHGRVTTPSNQMGEAPGSWRRLAGSGFFRSW